MDKIGNEITQISNITVGLLVVANCAKALEPNRIIPRQGGESYAFRGGNSHQTLDISDKKMKIAGSQIEMMKFRPFQERHATALARTHTCTKVFRCVIDHTRK